MWVDVFNTRKRLHINSRVQLLEVGVIHFEAKQSSRLKAFQGWVVDQYKKYFHNIKETTLIFSKTHLLGIKGNTYLTQILRARFTFPAKLQHKCNFMLLFTGHTVTLELGNYHDRQKFKITIGYYLSTVLQVNISVNSRYSCNI